MQRVDLLVIKKVLVALAIVTCVTALTGYSHATAGHNSETQSYYCDYGQCSKIKDDGKRCKNCSQRGSIYCWSHRN